MVLTGLNVLHFLFISAPSEINFVDSLTENSKMNVVSYVNNIQDEEIITNNEPKQFKPLY